MFLLKDSIEFPPVELADEDGLLAIGGDLSKERLIHAYSKGIFPWYNEDEPICWWCPDPRFVLFPEEIQVSKSMQRVCNSNVFQFKVNTRFAEVIATCKSISRKGQHGTWISPAVQEAYTRLHKDGHAHSAEAWQNGKLVGGLYGIRMGNIFFGESMFSKTANASKFALISYVELLRKEGVKLIDCQVYTAHLESLGACMIPRATFAKFLSENI